MPHKINVGSKLIINGFTINPIKDKDVFKVTLESLFDYDYKQMHHCDFDLEIIHTNYLKKPIIDSFVFNIKNQYEESVIGFVVLENGYYILKIIYNKHPAQIQLDMYLDEPILDPGLIIDHLCAPAVPFDGLGMFDYTYSVFNISRSNSVVSDNYNNIRYTNNESFNMSQFNGDENYAIILNELKEIHCFYCEGKGENFVFTQDSRKVVSVCKNHVNSKNASSQEAGYSGSGPDLRIVRKYGKNFTKVINKDKHGNIVSKHVKENNG